jgi:sugar O-acyltransferase (sialic acid O-acetyltransferase NeuD family)
MDILKKKQLVIFGNSPTAKLASWYFERNNFEVASFTVNQDYIVEPVFCNKPLIPFEDLVDRVSPYNHGFYAAIGATQMNDLRTKIYNIALEMGFEMQSLVSPKAVIFEGFNVPSHCRIGDGAIIQPFVTLGNNTVIGGGSIVGHDTIIGNNTFVAGGAIIGGEVTIGENCFIGTGAVIKSKVVLGDRTVVGAGVTLLESTSSSSVYMNSSTQKMPFTSDKIKF